MDRGGSDGSFVISGSLCKQTLFLSVDGLPFNQGVDALFVFFGRPSANVIYLRFSAALACYCFLVLAEKDCQRNPCVRSDPGPLPVHRGRRRIRAAIGECNRVCWPGLYRRYLAVKNFSDGVALRPNCMVETKGLIVNSLSSASEY